MSLIAHALGFPFSQDSKHEWEQQVPPQTFGVFVSVKRSQKLSTWPEDIHGCIGYWDPARQVQSAEIIVDHLFDVARSAVWQDDRRKYFPTIYQDPRAVLEIDFMTEWWPIDPHTGWIPQLNKPFTNGEFGLLVDSSQVNSRATYLPHVFLPPLDEWKTIRASVLQKAHLDQGQTRNKGEVSFYAYHIHQVRMQIGDILQSKAYLEFVIRMSTQTIDRLILHSGDLPYLVITNKSGSWKTQIDPSETVRNMALIADRLASIPSPSRPVAEILWDKLNRFLQTNDHDLQALSFAIQPLALTGRKMSEPIYQLMRNLKGMEPDFQLGETLTALTVVAPSQKKVVQRVILAVCQHYLDRLLFREQMKTGDLKLNSIFRFNWYAQFVARYKLWTFDLDRSLQFQKRLEISIQKLLVPSYFQLETNYLAVAFEALCALSRIAPLSRQALDHLFHLFCVLQTRNVQGLYFFKESKESRLDLTGHVLEGLMWLFNGIFRLV